MQVLQPQRQKGSPGQGVRSGPHIIFDYNVTKHFLDVPHEIDQSPHRAGHCDASQNQKAPKAQKAGEAKGWEVTNKHAV